MNTANRDNMRTAQLACDLDTAAAPQPAMHYRSSRGARGRLLIGLVALLAAGCQTIPENLVEVPDNDAAHNREFTLGAGDQVRVIVYGHQDLSGKFELDSVGRVSMPLIQGVDALGLTTRELEQSVAKRLEENFFADPKVSIELIEARPFCVLGEVKNPGCYKYIYGMNAAMAISAAGGYTYRAVKNEFVLTRTGGDQYRGRHDTIVFPGNVIEVYERYY